MGLLDLFKRKKENKRDYFSNFVTRYDSNTKAITEDNSLALTAVYSAVRIISETIAQLPFNYYLETDKGNEIYRESPLDLLVSQEPNNYQTKYVFFETMMNSLILYGNAYAYIEKINNQPVSLYCLDPRKVQVKYIDGNLIYNVLDGNYDSSQIIHIPDFTTDGYTGKSRIIIARDSIEHSLRIQDYGLKFFRDGARFVSGILTHPGKLSPEAMKNLKQSWQATYNSQQFNTAVLEEGMKFENFNLAPEQAQYLQSREFSVREISRIMKVPVFMLSDHAASTYSNIEHESLNFAKNTITPLLSKIEQEFNKKLIPDVDKGKTYFLHNLRGLLRGDSNSRADYYGKLFNIGVLSQNDIRKMESMSTIDDGDKYFVPLNMVAVEKQND